MSWTLGQFASVLLCHPWFPTTNLSYKFPIVATSATASCGYYWKYIYIYRWLSNQQTTSSKQSTETSLIRRKSIWSTWQNLAGLRCWAWRSFTIWRWRRCQCPRNLGCPFVHSSGCCASVRVEFCWDFWADENDPKRQWRSDKFCQLSRGKTWDWWLFLWLFGKVLKIKDTWGAAWRVEGFGAPPFLRLVPKKQAQQQQYGMLDVWIWKMHCVAVGVVVFSGEKIG